MSETNPNNGVDLDANVGITPLIQLISHPHETAPPNLAQRRSTFRIDPFFLAHIAPHRAHIIARSPFPTVAGDILAPPGEFHAQTDELLRAVKKARTGFVDLEDLSDDEIKQIEDAFRYLHDKYGDSLSTPHRRLHEHAHHLRGRRHKGSSHATTSK